MSDKIEVKIQIKDPPKEEEKFQEVEIQMEEPPEDEPKFQEVKIRYEDEAEIQSKTTVEEKLEALRELEESLPEHGKECSLELISDSIERAQKVYNDGAFLAKIKKGTVPPEEADRVNVAFHHVLKRLEELFAQAMQRSAS